MKHIQNSRSRTFLRNITYHLESISLVKKLVLAYILILAIPIIIFGITYLNSIRKSAEMEIEKNNIDAVTHAKEAVLKNIEICLKASQTVISNKEFVNFFYEDESEQDTETLMKFKRGLLANIENIANINPDINHIRLFINQVDILEMWPIVCSEKYIAEMPWREEVIRLEGKAFWRMNHMEESLQITSTATPENVISLYRAVQYPDSTHLGVLEVNMLSRNFFKEMYDNPNDPDTLICIVKGKDTLLLDEKNKFFEKAGIDNRTLLEMLNKYTDANSGSVKIKDYKNLFMVAFERLPEIDSYVYKVTCLQSFNQNIYIKTVILILMILGLIAILTLATGLMTSVLLKKLKRIVNYMRKIQDGNLNIDIPVYGNDEVGELAYHFKKMMVKINELIEIVLKKQEAVKEAELKSLQSQMDKHFIYNMVESIKMMAEIQKQYELSDTVTSFGRMLRYNMTWKEQYVFLKDEIEHIKDYIRLKNVMNSKSTNLYIDIDEALLQQEILKMSLQPIVENSVSHGIEPGLKGGSIYIHASHIQDILLVEVLDDGVGIPKGSLENLKEYLYGNSDSIGIPTSGNGIGIKNVHDRIQLFYGKEYGIDILSEEGCYTKVSLRFPYRKF